MRRRCFLEGILLAISAVCFLRPLYAIDPNRLISQYIRDHWGSENGFTGGKVTALAQTVDGYLWIGTEQGLFRFDGLTFRRFPLAIPTAIPIGPVQQLFADSKGNLWVVLQSTRILRYHGGIFEPGSDEAEFGITSIHSRRDGTVLLSSIALGIMAYRGGKFEILTSPGEPARSPAAASPDSDDTISSHLSWATGVTSHRLAEPDSAVVSMAETTDGRVWLATRDNGLFYLSEGHIFRASRGLPSSKINCLLALEHQELWIGTERGIARWDGKEFTPLALSPALSRTPILAMGRDHDLNIWVGTANGLLRVSANGGSVDADRAPATGAVGAFFEDREGDLWVGGSHGLDRLRDSAFVTYLPAELQSQSGGPVFVDQDDRVWFAAFEGGLRWLNGKSNGSTDRAGLDRDVIYSITGSKDELWIGRRDGGLTNLRKVSGRSWTRTYTTADGLAQNSVYAVHQSRDGSIWAGTPSGGVSRFLDGRFTTYTTANGLASNSVVSIAETPDRRIWFAAPNSLSTLLDGQWHVFGSSEGLPQENINCLFSDSSGILWVGTSAGLGFIRSGRFYGVSETPPALREPIFGIAEDKNGWLWIATSAHVLCAKRESLLGGLVSKEEVREFGLADGLKGTEGVKREQSVFADAHGSIWFSMNRGLSVVDPSRVRDRSTPTLVHIEAASADGNELDLGAPIRIPSARRRILIRYAGLCLSDPDHVRYRYRLDGFDGVWSEPVSSREAVYTNLSPGSYVFRLMASNSSGEWSEAVAALPLTIVPEFYGTKWFLLFSVLGALGLAWVSYQWHLRQVTARLDLQFKERLSERSRIARELHDTLLQSFQGLMLHFQTALNLLPGHPAEAVKKLENALLGAEQAIVQGRNAIHDIRSSPAIDNNLADAVTMLGQELGPTVGSGRVPKLSVIVEGSEKTLDPITRDEIYGIVREALRNAFRHAQAAHIEVEITYGDRSLGVRIRDDGNGLDPKVVDRGARAGHWGLPGMRERAERIGGTLVLWSEPGSGTEVELVVPGPAAYRMHPVRLKFKRFPKKERSKL